MRIHGGIASTVLIGVACCSAHADAALAPSAADMTASAAGPLQEITVTAQRLGLLGSASTASERLKW